MSDTSFDRSVLGFEAAQLLQALLEKAGEDGRAQVPAADLMKASGLTQGALLRARTELTQRGLLTAERGYSANGLRVANVYTVNRTALGLVSSTVPTGESGQNRAAEVPITRQPADSQVRTDSSEPRAERKGLLARIFRRSRRP